MTSKPRTKPRKPGKLVPQPHGGAIQQGGTNPGGGRPPDEFKALCRQLISRKETFVIAKMILDDPKEFPTLYIGALKWATEHGYGKPKESVELTGKDGGPIQVWKWGKREITF